MSIQLNKGALAAGIMVLSLSLIIYKLWGGAFQPANFISGLLAGIGMVVLFAFLYVAVKTGLPVESR